MHVHVLFCEKIPYMTVHVLYSEKKTYVLYSKKIQFNGYHDLPKRTFMGTETDLYGYRNGPQQTSVGTETDLNRLQLIPKRTSMGTRKGRVGNDRNDPNKIMYVWVGRYVCR